MTKERSNVLNYLSGNILSSLIPFLLMPIMTRYLSPSEYGHLALFMITAAFLGAISPVGGVYVLTRYSYKNKTGINKSDLIVSIMLISIISTFFILLGFKALEPLLNIDFVPIEYFMIGVISVCLTIQKLRNVLWQVNKQSAKYATLQITISIINFLVSFLLVVMLLQGVFGRMAGYALSIFIAALISIYFMQKERVFDNVFISRESIFFCIKKGAPLVPHIMASYFLVFIERGFINKELSIVSVGLYFAAYQLANGFKTIIDAINKAYVPWLFERLASEDTNKFKDVLKVIFRFKFFLLIACPLVVVTGKHFFELVVGSDFHSAFSVFIILSIGHLVNGGYLSVANIVFFDEQAKMISFTTTLSAVIQVLMIYYLGKQYGIDGVAYAFLFGAIVKYCLTTILAIHCWKKIKG